MSIDVMTLEKIPFYNEDLDCPPGPPVVENMKKLIAESDGVLIATPEYNHEIPSVLKNALDWASRPAFQSCFKTNPFRSSILRSLTTCSPKAPCDAQRNRRLAADLRAEYARSMSFAKH
jgi:chromate reductase